MHLKPSLLSPSLSATLVALCALFLPPLSGVAQTAPPSSLSEFQTAYPISIPTYDGVEQLLVLSDRWLIVATSTEQEVVNEIDKLSGGKMLPAVALWDATRDTDRPNWTARNTMRSLREQYYALGRINAGEDLLDLPISYQISSAADPRYRVPLIPLQVGRTLVGLGDAAVTGGPEVDYINYSYIYLPQPLRNNTTYTVTVRGTKRVTFLFDTNRTVSRAIKTNQVGYLPDAPRKFAYMGCHIYEVGPMDFGAYPRFEVVNAATGAVALAGTVRLRDNNSRIVPLIDDNDPSTVPPLLTGEKVYEMDFSALSATGNFFIRVPGVGRSWPFYHGPDAYGEAFYTAARGMFHQRCGIALGAPYTNWPRIKCHTDPIYESDMIAFGKGIFNPPAGYQRFDVVGGSLDKTRQTNGATGGWHDAADWDRNNAHYTPIFDLLNAYEMAPERFSDGQLNLPESANGIPDVLDEAAYGLLVWQRSMNSAGGVSGFVETSTHPLIDSDIDYAFSRRTRWDSLMFAAAAIQLAEHMKPFDSTGASRWAWYANRAYAFGMDPKNSLGLTTIRCRANRGLGDPYTLTWEEKQEYIDPFILHAKVRMFRYSGKKDYLADVPALIAKVRKPFKWPYSMVDYSPWIFYGIVNKPGVVSETQRAELIKSHFTTHADSLLAYTEEMPYRCTWPRNQDFWMSWGATDMANAARGLLATFALTGDQKYRDSAILNMDYMLGANPMGMSWTTGLGYSYPTDIQHGVSELDGIADPVPGITVYGVTEGMHTTLRDTVWRSPGGVLSPDLIDFKVPDVPLWRRWSCHPIYNTRQCEFTVQETISPTLFCSAMLMSPGWKPTNALKSRQPRPAEFLYGTWYLP